MSRIPEPQLNETEHLLVYGLTAHGVPRRTAVTLAKRFSGVHILRQMCYFNYDVSRHPEDPNWRWLVTRIQHQEPEPSGYPWDLKRNRLPTLGSVRIKQRGSNTPVTEDRSKTPRA